MLRKDETSQLTLSKTQLVGTIVSAVIGTAVITSFSLLRVANNDHFTIVALSEDVKSLKSVIVPRSEFEVVYSRFDSLDSKIDSLYKILIEQSK